MGMIDCVPVFSEERGAYVCMVCGFSRPVHFRKNCENQINRTAGDVLSIIAVHCSRCSEYRDGMCQIFPKEGCGSCREPDDFRYLLLRGVGCPFPITPRFPSTATQRVAPTS
jgi:hypothetical protein